MASPNWSSLPIDIITLILNRLPVIDFVRSRSTCKSWNLPLARGRCSPHPQPPWLMNSSLNTRDTLTFSSLLNLEKVCTIHLPELRGRPWRGSTSAGHLIFADEDASELIVLNPLTVRRIPFPPIATIPNIAATFQFIHETYSSARVQAMLAAQPPRPPRPLGDWVFKKAVLSNPGDNYPPTVAMICGIDNQLAFAIAGGESWARMNTRLITWHEIIFHKGLLHGLCFFGDVLVSDLREHPPSQTLIPFNLDDLYEECGAPEDYPWKFLVESTAGQLLQVWCTDYLPRAPDDDDPENDWMYLTTPFVIFELDSSTRKWFIVQSLGEDVLMLGHKHSCCVSARDFPELKENCIYFALFKIPALGVYNLEDGNIEHLLLREPEVKWFAPSLL